MNIIESLLASFLSLLLLAFIATAVVYLVSLGRAAYREVRDWIEGLHAKHFLRDARRNG